MFVTQSQIEQMKAKAAQDRYATIEWRDEYLPIVVLAAGSIAAVALAKIVKKKRKRR